MEQDKLRLLQEAQLQFFGKINASVSHEVNNVFAIINENAGLLSDWLNHASKGNSIDYEKLIKITQSIHRQLERGEDIVKGLNHFAHSVDTPVRIFDVKNVTENIVMLANRLAYQKKVTLKTKYPMLDAHIENNPFLIRNVIFLSIEALLLEAQPGSSITIKVKKESSSLLFIIKGETLNKNEKSEVKLSLISDFAQEMKGSVEISFENTEITIALPRNFSAE